MSDRPHVGAGLAPPWPSAPTTPAEASLDPATHTRPRPHLYVAVFVCWAVAVAAFQPRLASLLTLADSPIGWAAIIFFIVFMQVAWLYAFYNLGIVVFAMLYRGRTQPALPTALPAQPPAIAILYTTCNDFVEVSARSCVFQDYPNFRVYILDDSSEPNYRRRIDAFAAKYPRRVRVVRRADRAGFKAGNLNHALRHVAVEEPLFALADADEVLPRDFLRRLTPRLLADPQCGFVQANHQCNRKRSGALGNAIGEGIDIHWRWYQPLRNRYGFVMLLGHGALLRRECWHAIGGFPHLVSEDLAFALRIRELGWRGRFAEDVVCYEDFPQTIRAFRVRHMKWTLGTCEFLFKETPRMLRARNVPWVEKLDVLFPTLNLPLSLFYFLFIIDANIVLTSLFSTPHVATVMFGGVEFNVPLLRLDPAFSVLSGADFFLITFLTLLSPILCFIIELARRPLDLFRFTCRSTAVWGALGPLSCIGVTYYLLTRRATFFVTGDRASTAIDLSSRVSVRGRGTCFSETRQSSVRSCARALRSLRSRLHRLLDFRCHPDRFVIQAFEILCGITFVIMCVKLLQVSFLGMAIAYVMLPVLHHVKWNNRVVRFLVYAPFLLMLSGLGFGALALAGVQPVLFNFGFHF